MGKQQDKPTQPSPPPKPQKPAAPSSPTAGQTETKSVPSGGLEKRTK